MLKLVTGDFFDYNADIRINTVNCVGVMGAGVALAFKKRFPEMFKDYAQACSKDEVQPGTPHVWHENGMFQKLTIVNFPTKIHWRDPSEYEYIEKGLVWLRRFLEDKEGSTVTVPALGCGHGGLDWNIVSKMIVEHLEGLDCTILLFEPRSSVETNSSNDYDEILIKEKVSTLLPNHDLYPKQLKGRSSYEIYLKGNEKLLSHRNISIFVNSKPQERERNSLNRLIEELPHRDFVFLLSYNNSYEVDIVKQVLSKGLKAIIVIPYGILQLKIRKDLLTLWDYDQIAVLSIFPPTQPWKNYQSIKALKFRLKISDIVLINSMKFNRFDKFEADFKSFLNVKYYINYWHDKVDFFNRISARKIGVSPNTRRPNISEILESIKALEVK